jgi:hypothetical protein
MDLAESEFVSAHNKSDLVDGHAPFCLSILEKKDDAFNLPLQQKNARA